MMELVCPAGTPASLKVAVDAGADSVYCGFRNETNARNFPGLNFSTKEMEEGIAYANANGSKVLVAINTFPTAGNEQLWRDHIDIVARCKAHAVILCDISLLEYARTKHPELRRHLSVQASASNPDSINWYVNTFGVSRVVLPRVMAMDQIAYINEHTTAELETFVYGGLCVMAEGRCSLSSYATGKSPNMQGVCSPASHVEYIEEGSELVSKLGEFTINRFGKTEPAGYPTLCKGRFVTGDEEENISYLFEDPISLNVSEMLPNFAKAGVKALKIEGRQRSKAYVKAVVQAFKQAVQEVENGETPTLDLTALSEGQRETQGAFKKGWK